VGKFISLLICLGLAAAADARGAIISAEGAWAAIDRGATCEALSRSVRLAARGKVQGVAGFTFSPDHRRWDEFHVRLRRIPRGGATVMLRIDSQPFLLVARGDMAWSDGPGQDQAIIGALRDASRMSVESRDQAGRRFIDYYATAGAPTAIDAAAARCSLRGAGKIR
jgi:hypothetical protein